MVAALWANSNWDDNKNSRKNMIASINESFKESVDAIEESFGHTQAREPEEPQIDTSNPFWAAAQRGHDRVEAYLDRKNVKRNQPEKKEEVPDLEAMMKSIDQA